MTTPIVPSISDEELADIEKAARRSYGETTTVSKQEIASIIARLRVAEADAKRYRWLRDKSVDADGVFPMVSLTDDCGDQVSNWLFGQAVDKAVDEAMERTP